MKSIEFSVTDSVIEEMSTIGYDFYWSKAINGYELRGHEDLVFDQEFYNDPRSKQAVYPNGFRYNRNLLLYYRGLNPTLPPHQSPLPVLEIDTQPPWLVEKESLELAQKEALTKPGPLDYQLVPTKQYKPLSYRTLHRKFAALDTDDLETEVLRFAGDYGELGRPVELWSPPDPDHPVRYLYAPHAFRWNLPPDKRALVYGESAVRWRAEVEKMAVLLTLWDMHNREAGKLGRFVHWLDNGSVDIRFKWQSTKGQYEISAWDGKQKLPGFGHHAEIIASRRFSPMFFDAYKPREVIGPALSFVSYMINQHLDGVTPRLIGRHAAEITYIPSTLLDALWLLCMLEVQGKIKTAPHCKFCLTPFDYKNNRKRFCCDNHRVYFHNKHKSKGGTP